MISICIYLLTCVVEGVQMPPLFYMQDITCLSQLQLNDRNGLTAPSLAGPQKNPVLAAIPRGRRMLTSESVPGSQKGPLSRELYKPRPL